jgi:hypothetical protein
VTLIEDEERPWETANPPAAAITTAPRARTFHARGVTQRISTCVGDSEITQPGDAPVQASLMRLVPGSGAYKTLVCATVLTFERIVAGTLTGMKPGGDRPEYVLR